MSIKENSIIKQSVNLAAIEDCINRNIMIIKRGDSAH
nr:MAG TPA: hypothetical protein [Caudoviricetes sp.]DAR80276.1 MAG TPA: hypothetical protein [Caudoviricetes sp.]DAV01812.1 MAG TPA: hypothetical protein [Caudoviricetes sp.]